ncbi:MAG: ComEA family DNA-binding protein [Deltaproteobacteria bacterium]
MLELTKQERQVVVFLLAVSGAGAAIECAAKMIPPLERREFLRDLGRIDLNKADTEALKSLPGIGDGLARRIIQYREDNNGFSDVAELSKVKGMRSSLVGRVRDWVCVR